MWKGYYKPSHFCCTVYIYLIVFLSIPFKFQNPESKLRSTFPELISFVILFLICLWLMTDLTSCFIAFFDEKVHSVQLPPVNSASFALRFLENFCRSMQCDKFLSSQPFQSKAHIQTSTTDLDQNKPGKKNKSFLYCISKKVGRGCWEQCTYGGQRISS